MAAPYSRNGQGGRHCKGQDVKADLVERARRGDQDAFAALVSGSADRCYAIAYRILRDPDVAQDATQQALLEAWRDLRSLAEVERFDAWLHRLVVNACYSTARRDRRWAAKIRLLPVDRATSPDTAAALADRDELERGFQRLSAEQRAVVVLHHYVGYPLTEVAATLDIPMGTARSRLHYAIQSLRAALDADARSIRTSGERMA